jgi:ribosomal protein S18 acetylase RimI-like enzyme
VATDDRWWGARARIQVSAWRGTDHTVVMTPVPDRPAPGSDDIRRELDVLQRAGVRTVLTGALHQGEVAPFERAGFVEHERLHLLRHDLIDIPAPAPVRLRRAWRRDHAKILTIDERAFDAFWALDRGGLEDAVRATPASRFRVSVDRAGPTQAITGYAVTGKAADRGYLQRLAVDPSSHRRGTGTALVADSLRWLRRSGARAAVVNTQEANQPAIALYLATGFVLEPAGLTVLRMTLAADPS